MRDTLRFCVMVDCQNVFEGRLEAEKLYHLFGGHTRVHVHDDGLGGDAGIIEQGGGAGDVTWLCANGGTAAPVNWHGTLHRAI